MKAITKYLPKLNDFPIIITGKNKFDCAVIARWNNRNQFITFILRPSLFRICFIVNITTSLYLDYSISEALLRSNLIKTPVVHQ